MARGVQLMPSVLMLWEQWQVFGLYEKSARAALFSLPLVMWHITDVYDSVKGKSELKRAKVKEQQELAARLLGIE